MSNSKTARLVETAMLIALATVLALISKLLPLQLPFGGSVTLVSMLPIVLISYRNGIRWGLMGAFVYAIIQILTGLDVVRAFFLPGDSQMVAWKAILVILFDYILAYTALGLGGLFRKSGSPVKALCLGSIVALALRYLCHIISGAIFFGTWAEWFFTDEFQITSVGDFVLGHFSGTGLAVVYSVIYNGLYMIPEIIITALAAALIARVPVVVRQAD
ncbi:MAG: energy-coupled thiamine transporter ThiT [Oscillospiraceae bacterium]